MRNIIERHAVLQRSFTFKYEGIEYNIEQYQFKNQQLMAANITDGEGKDIPPELAAKVFDSMRQEEI